MVGASLIWACLSPLRLSHSALSPSAMRILICLLPFLAISNGATTVAKATLREHGATGKELGELTFTQEDGSKEVHITGILRGITGHDPRRAHGFHVHQNGNVSKGCTSAGSHFNPRNLTHGGPKDPEQKQEGNTHTRHIGDLGIVTANSEDIVSVKLTDSVISLDPTDNVHYVGGRAIVIHEDNDDLGRGTGDKRVESLKTGNAGKRLGCGVIQVETKASNAVSVSLLLLLPALLVHLLNSN